MYQLEAYALYLQQQDVALYNAVAAFCQSKWQTTHNTFWLDVIDILSDHIHPCYQEVYDVNCFQW